MPRHFVCALTDLEDDKPRCFRIEQTDVMIARHEMTVYALQNRCGHMAAALHLGDFTDGLIVCPLHGAAFRVDTGAVEWDAILPPPMSEWVDNPNPRLNRFGQLLNSIETLPIQTYPVDIENGSIYVSMPSK